MDTSFTLQKPAIVIMAKVPRAGLVKTRLHPILSESQTVELAICFLKDTVSKAKRLSENVIVAFAPAGCRREMEMILRGKRTILIKQQGSDLGERMRSAIKFAEKRRFNPIIVVGCDSPTMPLSYIKQAFEAFKDEMAESVLGATSDGGFYLLGLRKWTDGVFNNIEWSSEKACAQTAKNLQKIQGCEPVQIPAWYDVDTPADLSILYREFSENEDFKTVAPETAKWLENNKNIFVSTS